MPTKTRTPCLICSTEPQRVVRKDWPEGPWSDEPDRREWVLGDMPCLMIRSAAGPWNGYVGVLKGHPAYEVDYMDGLFEDIDVHGKLTFSGRFHSRDAFWFLGFDCDHECDAQPSNPSDYEYVEYRDVPYVEDQVIKLADQLMALAGEMQA